MSEQKHIHVIANGTVIDHIAQGMGRIIAELIGSSNDVIVVGMNMDSKRMNKKDILKYANKLLTSNDVLMISALSPGATISEIRDGNVVNKITLTKPDVIKGIFLCPNPKCITNYERVITVFHTDPQFRCFFCERTIDSSEIKHAAKQL